MPNLYCMRIVIWGIFVCIPLVGERDKTFLSEGMGIRSCIRHFFAVHTLCEMSCLLHSDVIFDTIDFDLDFAFVQFCHLDDLRQLPFLSVVDFVCVRPGGQSDVLGEFDLRSVR